MQRHRPEPMPHLHTHRHVEVLLPVGCELSYLTQLGPSTAPSGHICVLWGQTPHRVITVTHDAHRTETQHNNAQYDISGQDLLGHDISGQDGEILIANLPLSELLSWSMPEIFMAQLFTGRLIIGNQADEANIPCFERWHADFTSGNSGLISLALRELQLCLLRQSLHGWRHDDHQQASLPKSSKRQVYRVQAMLRFLAENFRQPTTVADVADRAGISKGHASALFQSQMNISIIGYLTELRLYHAQSALANSDEKIVNIALDAGFGSMSQFYEIFQRTTGLTPQKWRDAQ